MSEDDVHTAEKAYEQRKREVAEFVELMALTQGRLDRRAVHLIWLIAGVGLGLVIIGIALYAAGGYTFAGILLNGLGFWCIGVGFGWATPVRRVRRPRPRNTVLTLAALHINSGPQAIVDHLDNYHGGTDDLPGDMKMPDLIALHDRAHLTQRLSHQHDRG